MKTTAGEERTPEIDADAWIEELLATAEHGTLGIHCADGWPRAVPLNFVYLHGRIYIHGAHEGEKMTAMARDPRVGFTVVAAGSLIPSYLRHPRSACPATQYYRSVMIRGRARFVDEASEKAEALQALMEKLQPEGGHERITAGAALYRKALAGVAVTAIEIESLSGKFKHGQNLAAGVRERVVRGLLERGGALDRETASRILDSIERPVHARRD